MSTHSVSSDIILQGRNNWELWVFVIKRIAEAGDVWEYIDPDRAVQPLQKPEKPLRPSAIINDDGSPATEPGQEAFAQYNADVNTYYKEIKEYRRLRDKLGQVEAHITKTISQDLLYHIKDKDSVYQQLKTLQELYSPTTADQEYRVQKAYESAKVLHARQSNIEDWCNDFLAAYSRTKQLDLPEAHGFRPHKDFIRAIKQIDSGYSATIAIDVFKAEETWSRYRDQPVPHESQLPTLVGNFLRYHRTTHSKKANIQTAAFGAKFNNKESPYSEKRGRNDGKPMKPCLCGDTHFWGQCPYIDTSLRPRGFVEDPDKAKKISDYEFKDKKGLLNKIREKNRRYKKLKTSNPGRKVDSDSIEIDAGDDPIEHTSHQAYAVFLSAFNHQPPYQHYPLLHSWTLDPATDVHICNNTAEFQWKAPAAPDDIVLAGGSEARIEAWGEVNIPLTTAKGTKTTTLKRVALIPTFFTSLVSLARLSSSNVHFDSGKSILYRAGTPREPIADLTRLGGHWLLVHRSEPLQQAASHTALHSFHVTNKRRPQHSALPARPRTLSKPQLHVLLGHAGSDAIDHLPSNVIGIAPPTGGSPKTINCEQCSQNKGHQIISRRIGHEIGASRPFETVAIDLIRLEATAYNGHQYVFHGIDLYTKLHFVFTIAKRDKATLLEILRRLDRSIKREFNTTVTFLIADDERGYGITDDSARGYCQQEGIKFQIRAPHVKEQNGSAERSGKSLIDRSRSMRVASNLPLALSPEIYMCAAYILNRTPTKTLSWKTPFEMAYGKKPSLAHLKIYGCRAYALRQQIPRGDKLSPRSLVGYLVGYDASNVYRIWLPGARSRAHQGKVVRVRDVTFKETMFYQSDKDEAEPILQGSDLEEFIQTYRMPTLHDPEDTSEDETENSKQPTIHPTSTSQLQPQLNQANLDKTAQPSMFPTPAPTSPSYTGIQRSQSIQAPTQTSHGNLQIQQQREPSPNLASSSRKRKRHIPVDSNLAQNRELIDSDLRPSHILSEGSKRSRKPTRKSSSFFVSTYWSSFVAASANAPKTQFHHTALPLEPRFYKDVMKLPYPHKEGFIRAIQQEIETVKRKDTFERITWSDFDAQNNEVLPLLWVFKYKLDSGGYLTKYKARICVRGDLQTTAEDTYAATLAMRIFRALMAIAAYFNMEIRQYDAVNAFTNAQLTTPVYCHLPEGFTDTDHLWKLNRALYALKTSPLLWYEELTQTFTEVGLYEVKDAPCLWKNDKLLVFFYVDDIVVLCLPAHTAALDDFERRLLNKYEIRSLGEIKVFCGTQVHRDRVNGAIWLSQASYIDKIAHKYPSPKAFSRPPSTPLPLEELLPSDEPKHDANTHRYAQLVGSIGYVAGATRPDVAKAHSKLAEFLVNPSQRHIDAAYQTIAYLQNTRDQALHYNASVSTDAAYISDHCEPDFFGATDASYADHKATRKSSQGYIFFLFGGPVDWKATLQRCVTKSTTEVELIAASSAGTELIWWWRVFRDIGFDPNNEQLLYCDNQQTIRLLEAATPRLKTSLRHVDIHHHWLRQESQANNINISYTQTNCQPADGLTKLLPRQKHEHWVSLLHFEPFPTLGH